MIEAYLVAYLVIGIAWAITMREGAEHQCDMPSELRFFDFLAGVLAWPAEAAATFWLLAVNGSDGPDRPA